MKQMKIPKAAALGMAAGVLISLVLAMLWAALIRAGALPESATRYGCWVGAAVAGLAMGTVAARQAGKSTVPVALTAVGLYWIGTAGAGMALAEWTGRGAALHGALTLLTALIGGVLASGGKHKSGKRKYRV